MQEALSLLIDLDPEDIEKMLSIGVEREVHRPELILVEGTEPDAMFIVLEGLVEVVLEARGGLAVRHLGPGELLGEVSWLEESYASASVRAAEDSVLLAIPHDALNALLEADLGFSARFHRSLGRVVARRLRDCGANSQWSAGSQGERESAQGTPPWLAILPAIDGLKDLMQEAEEITRKAGGTPPLELVERTHAGFGAFCDLLTREIGQDSSIPEDLRKEIGRLVRRELHPYLMLTRIVERIYTKPRGYAGDFLTIRWMYENETGGIGAAGQLIDGAFLQRPAALAVRNRRGLLGEAIDQAIGRAGNVMSLACGPAQELFDVFERRGPEALKAICLDIDLQALALVSDQRDRLNLKRQMRLEQANLVYLATGRSKIEVPPQDLIYSIGLIDYFQDRFVIALLDWIYDNLAPGGQVVLGNFHPKNPDRALMDHVLDWRLIHRDEADMNRLFRASKFAAPCSELRLEEAGVNLFAFGQK